MNLNLADVVCTSKDGDQFWKLNECYVRGSSIKYLRLPEEAVEKVDESEEGRWKGGGRGGRELLVMAVGVVEEGAEEGVVAEEEGAEERKVHEILFHFHFHEDTR